MQITQATLNTALLVGLLAITALDTWHHWEDTDVSA
jgi:hypothetical protein